MKKEITGIIREKKVAGSSTRSTKAQSYNVSKKSSVLIHNRSGVINVNPFEMYVELSSSEGRKMEKSEKNGKIQKVENRKLESDIFSIKDLDFYDLMKKQFEMDENISKLGLDTELSKLFKDVKNDIDDNKTPFDVLYRFSNFNDEQIIHLLDGIFKKVLLKYRNFIKHAVRNFDNQLGYTLFLKKYNNESIAKIFEIENEYEQFPLSNRYPVYFELLDINDFSLDDVHIFEKVF